MIGERSNAGWSVQLQHIYSHIRQKKAQAKIKGGDHAARLKAKLVAIRALLPGDFKQWRVGNESVDDLANVGHGAPLLYDKWTII